MFKIFKKEKTEKLSFIKDIRYNIITYTVKFEYLEYIKEWFEPEKIAYINYNTRGKYFIIGIFIE